MTAEAEETWDEIADLWVDGYGQRLWRRHSDAVNRSLIERWLPARGRRALKTDLFDEAVGEGLYPALAERYDSVAAVDSSPPIVRAALARYPELDGVCADVRRLPYPDGSFDAVLSNSTLDHFDRPAEIVVALRELERVLEPGGRLVVTLDNPANPVIALMKALPRDWLNRLWFRHARGAASIGLTPYYVGATLSERELQGALSRLGFQVEASTTVVHCPRPLAAVVAARLERGSTRATQERFADALMRFEGLSRYPTRVLTGYFTAVVARRR